MFAACATYFCGSGLKAANRVHANVGARLGTAVMAIIFPGDTMLFRKTIASISSLLLLGFLAGCGSSSNSAVAPPSGGFSKSNLSGTYVFSTSGSDSTTGEPLMIMGAFTADGSGSISAGNVDIAAPGLGTPGFASTAITGGSGYSITADGRGQVKLSGTAVGTMTLDFVLQSSSHGLVTEFDANGTGSGTIDLQNSPTVGTNYAFSLSGVTTGIEPFAVVGAFTVGVGGVEDFNDAFAYTAATLTTSTVTLGTGTAPGTAQLASTVNTTPFTYDVYAIDSTHFKFIENDAQQYVAGDVFQQTSAQMTTLPSGTLAFTMAGIDSGSNPIALGGLVPVDSGGNITGGLEDYNDAGANVGQSTAVAGGFSALNAQGRSQLTLTSFENGGGAILGTSIFAAYPSTGGTLLLEIDGAGDTSGSAFVQSSTTLAASQGYGLNLSAVNVASGSGAFFEEDDIAEFTTTSSGFSGLIDLNDQGTTLSFDKTLDGNYTVSGGRGTASFLQGTSSSALAWFNAIFYPVDGTNFLMIESDTTQVGTGTFELQSTPGGSSTAIARPLFTRPRPMGHLARKTKTQ